MNPRTPVSTYRVQVRASFDLDAAADVIPYLRDLGVDWVYLSPLLVAEPGSDHGYDVVDHSTVDPDRGGPDALARLSAAARAAGMGVLVDIVPNHMGVATPAHNAWWWDVLLRGRESRYADAFDIDWDFAGGKLRIPVLGPDTTLTIQDGQLDYFGLRFPINWERVEPVQRVEPVETTSPSDPDGRSRRARSADEVHAAQHYELIDWRRADAELNYRRFFAVNSLAAIRVELPWVFDESHAEIVRWVREGLVDGLRVDHPDGLLDPGGYLDDLARATDSTYVLVEKILEGDEQLPPHWQTAGTTGYDALGDLDRVLVDPAGQRRLDAVDGGQSWQELIVATRLGIANGILRAEILRIARLLPDTEGAESTTADVIAELAASFPVYRSYLPHGAEHLAEAAAAVRARRPDLVGVLDQLLPWLMDPEHPAAQRLQQTTGMVMAKGVEDTAFYRYSRLASLTEVGGDPSEFSIDVTEFHARQERRQALFPASQTTLSTHDTKRGEDVRARIDVLSELPGQWRDTIERLRQLVPLHDARFENLLWESIVGAWPASRERLHAYAEKASREAGDSTSWGEPNQAFEARMHALVDAAFDDPRVRTIVEELVERIAAPGWSNSLSAKLLQLMAPGVPDVYQGSELWETSLVDPDNRRPVDFDERRRILADLDAGWLPPVDATGAAKLLITSRALRLRRDRPELFTRYLPVPVLGDAAEHVISFDRGGAVAVATRLAVRRQLDFGRTGWGDTSILVPGRPVIDVLTGARFDGGRLALGALLARYPVALLAADGQRRS
jgi:(1->4)-alpha-D-glucan 1-alpha-D-glucosylmutase